jgi:hypothetical protein
VLGATPAARATSWIVTMACSSSSKRIDFVRR